MRKPRCKKSCKYFYITLLDYFASLDKFGYCRLLDSALNEDFSSVKTGCVCAALKEIEELEENKADLEEIIDILKEGLKEI